MLKITYLVTVYNEFKTVQKAIEDVANINYPNKEIIIIDNGSQDGSREIIENYKNKKIKIYKILRNKNMGFGKSVTEGIKKATGDYIFIQYSDLEYDHKRSIYMMDYAKDNNLDVVLGSRLKNKTQSLINIIINKPAYLATLICTFLINIFYGHKFTDIIGGKLYKTKSIKKIKTNSYHAGFDFEFISRICKKKLKIGEISIKYWPRINSSEKKIKFYHMLNALYEIFKVKLFK
jgi:glycosyltransferase involved in cell wall biosynthesis